MLFGFTVQSPSELVACSNVCVVHNEFVVPNLPSEALLMKEDHSPIGVEHEYSNYGMYRKHWTQIYERKISQLQ